MQPVDLCLLPRFSHLGLVPPAQAPLLRALFTPNYLEHSYLLRALPVMVSVRLCIINAMTIIINFYAISYLNYRNSNKGAVLFILTGSTMRLTRL